MEALIEETMRYLSTAEKVPETDLLALGAKHLDLATPLESVSSKNCVKKPLAVAGMLALLRVAVFFLLAAAWVDPGRNALQSAEQRCWRRYVCKNQKRC